MVWRTVARELASTRGVCLLAPDLRGRGHSAGLPGPYGVAAHVTDLVAVLDHAGAKRVVLVGHSMGAYLVARLAAQHPERVAAVVLLDGGLYIPIPPDQDPHEVIRLVVEQGMSPQRAAVACGADRSTGYRWLARFRCAGWAGLVDRPSVPRRRQS